MKSSVRQRADWVIDLGPGGGESGGHIVAQGPPEEVAMSPKIHHLTTSETLLTLIR